MSKLHENYINAVNSLPPIEGEVVDPGMNWIWFEGYKDRHAAFLRFCQLTGQEIPVEREDEVCKHFGIDTSFRLHY